MFSFVLPLRAIVFQMLFLAIAIAIEAWVFQNRWKLGRKASVEYSIGLNLFSTCLGWLLFFALQPLLSTNLKKQIINYVFFNNIVENPNVPQFLLYGEVALIVFLAFVFILIAELIFLDVWRNLIKEVPKEDEERPGHNKYNQAITSSMYRRYYTAATGRVNSGTILVANAYSSTVILLLLFVKNLFGFW